MTKRGLKRTVPLGDPSLDHASALVQEYTRKMRATCHRIRDIRAEYYAANEKRLKLSSVGSANPRNHSPYKEQLWFETVNDFRTRHDEYVKYLRALIPQARTLAQHVSQLITHGTDRTVVKIELSLRVAELESAIDSAIELASSNLAFQVP